MVKTNFYFDDNTDQPLKAGGVLFYKINTDSNDIDFLLIKNRNKYEDFGGRIDDEDKSILETISREVEEESNGIFKKKDIIDKLKYDDAIYFKHSKYLIYLIELTDKIDPKIFGTKEIHDNIDRTVEWISYKNYKHADFIKKNLNFRLKFKGLFDKMIELHNTYFPACDDEKTNTNTTSDDDNMFIGN